MTAKGKTYSLWRYFVARNPWNKVDTITASCYNESEEEKGRIIPSYEYFGGIAINGGKLYV